MQKGVVALALMALLPLYNSPTYAQTYPNKSIRIVVPFGPGGPTDVAARVAAQVLQADFGQPVVIENRPGAGGATGSKSVAAAAPDGYTLLLATAATLGVIPALVANPGFDPVKSFAAVARVADSTTILVVSVNLPVNSIFELIAYDQANPGKLSYASAGVGNLTHLTAELLNARAGIKAIHVPYKSGAEMLTAVMSGQVQIAFSDVSVALPLIKDKKVKALAVTSGERHPQVPDVPTMAESGITDYVTTFWAGIVAPAGTPATTIMILNAALNRGLRSQQVQESLARTGAQAATPNSPQEFENFIAAEVRKWSEIAQTAKARLE